jgi:hypothetical protein
MALSVKPATVPDPSKALRFHAFVTHAPKTSHFTARPGPARPGPARPAIADAMVRLTQRAAAAAPGAAHRPAGSHQSSAGITATRPDGLIIGWVP